MVYGLGGKNQRGDSMSEHTHINIVILKGTVIGKSMLRKISARAVSLSITLQIYEWIYGSPRRIKIGLFFAGDTAESAHQDINIFDEIQVEGKLTTIHRKTEVFVNKFEVVNQPLNEEPIIIKN